MTENKKKEPIFFHNCLGDQSSCIRKAKVNTDILDCVRKIAIQNQRPSPRKEDWLAFAEIFPRTIDDAAALIDEGKIQCICHSSEHGNIYRVYSGAQIYTIFSNYNYCSCNAFRLVSTHEGEVTCEHVLACVIVDLYKLVEVPTDNLVSFDIINLPCEYPDSQS